jgi:CBS domain-containing protein
MSKIMNTKVRSVMSKPVVVEPSMKVSQMITTLSNSNSFDAFCRQNNATFNINMRDLLQSKDIVKMGIEPLFNAVPSISANSTLDKAIRIITHNRIRAAPVVQDGEIVGVVESKNILKLISELDNRWITANQIFTPNPIVIDKQTPLITARRIMTTKRIDHLPVVNKDAVSQVLTSYHLLQTILPPERISKQGLGARKVRNLEASVGNLGTNRMASCTPLDTSTAYLILCCTQTLRSAL